MVQKKKELPEEHDLAIVTVNKVFSHGAFAKLDEYENREGFIHISEVASTWIKNIRDYVREGQKTVAKVQRINRHKGHIDLSIRRVSDTQKKNKMQEWKRAQKADKLLELTAKGIEETLDEAYKNVGFKLEGEFGEIYAGLEEISMYGKEALENLDIPEVWQEPLIKLVEENVTVPVMDITGYLDVQCPTNEGVECIKKALTKARDSVDEEDVTVDIRYVGSPRYSVKIVAPDYKTAEESLKKCTDIAIDHLKENGGTGTFIREIKEES